jgi:hypothetical protein
VTYGNGQFVAVGGYSGMTSPDGITWTSSNVQSFLSSVTYGNGLFVAAGWNELVTSPDGIIWTSRISSNDFLNSVTYGNGLFVVTMNNSVKTSLDGITWTDRPAVQGNWRPITYGNGQFVAVSSDGVMTNSATISPSQPVINSITPTINSASVVFSAPENSGTSAISNYEYSLDNGSSWITPSPAIITSPILISGLESSTNYLIQLRAVNDAGFSCASLMVSETTLSPVATPTASNQTFCGSKTVADLKAIGTDLKWYDAETGGNVLMSSTVLASGTYYVSQTVNGNESERTSVAVTVNEIPSSGTISGANSLCIGKTINLTPSVTGGTWTTSAPTIATVTNGSVNGIATGTATISYTVISGNCSSIGTKSITVEAAPVVTLSGSYKICAGGRAIMKASVAGGVWGVENSALIVTSTQGFFRNPATPATDNFKTGITYTVKSALGACTTKARKTLIVRNVTGPTITVTAPKTSLNVNEIVTATANTSIAATGVWSSMSSLVSATRNTINTKTAAVKGLKVSSVNANVVYYADDAATGCRQLNWLTFSVAAASSIVDVVASHRSQTDGVHIYPNPSNGKFTFENIDGATSVKLVDLSGRVIATQPIVTGIATVDFSSVAIGKYMVHITGETINEVQPIVIE